MAEEFLEKFVGNHTRARIIRAFLFNQDEPMTVARIVKRAGVSAQAAGHEIRNLESMGIVVSKKSAVVRIAKHSKSGKRKESEPKATREMLWAVNPQFRHLRALSSFVHEVSPIRHDNILHALKHTGRLSVVIATGCFMGDVTRPVDLVVVADNLNENRLEHAIKSLEPLSGREIRYSAFGTPEFSYRLTIQDRLIRDILDYPHKIILDRTGILD